MADEMPDKESKQEDALRRIEISQMRLLADKRPNDFLKIAEELFRRLTQVPREVTNEQTMG